MTFCAREKEDGANFFWRAICRRRRRLSHAQEERPFCASCGATRCDDAFCWNAPNKLSFLFFFLPRRIFIGKNDKKKGKALVLVAVWRIISLTDDASNERKRKCKGPKIH